MTQYTQDEIREMFLEHLRGLVEYWNKVEGRSTKEKLSGLAFSILSTLDGCDGDFPAFELIPAPHPDDKEYNEGNGDPWWPPLPEDLLKREDVVTVHGRYMLHELFYKKETPQQEVDRLSDELAQNHKKLTNKQGMECADPSTYEFEPFSKKD